MGGAEATAQPVRRRTTRWTHWGPLSGLAFCVLVVAGGFGLEQSTPGAKASPTHVIAFYTAHRQRERAGAIVVTFSFIAFLFFSAALRSRWRRRSELEGLSAALLAAATLVVAGQTTATGLVYALTDAPRQLTRSTAQTLNLLKNDLVLTTAAGFFAFALIAAVAILRTRVVPRWLGWTALAIGILFVTPLEFAAFLLLLAWTTTMSVLLLRTERDLQILGSSLDHPPTSTSPSASG